MLPSRAIPFALAIFLSAGCSSQQSAQSAASPTAAATAPASSAAASPAASSSAVAVATASFTDIAGIFGAQTIQDEAGLGILDSTSGAFQPNAPVSRAVFVRWLVKANNVYAGNQPAQQIRLAQGGSSSFVDVSPSNPDFPYIQGLANTGYVIGVDAKHFAPNRLPTRETMVAIEEPLDLAANFNRYNPGLFTGTGLTDEGKIAKPYRTAVFSDLSNGRPILARVYGTFKTLQPQKAVTRSEAAVAVSEIGYVNPRGTFTALGQTPPP
jgi:hypothetical protein